LSFRVVGNLTAHWDAAKENFGQNLDRQVKGMDILWREKLPNFGDGEVDRS
jgi:hypothetical protein